MSRLTYTRIRNLWQDIADRIASGDLDSSSILHYDLERAIESLATYGSAFTTNESVASFFKVRRLVVHIVRTFDARNDDIPGYLITFS